MIFTDTGFWYFLFLLISLIHFLPKKTYPYVICGFSIFFYGSLNFQFLIPLFFCLAVDFTVCLLLSNREGLTRKLLMLLGIGINLLLLFYYKYYFNFASELFKLTDIQLIVQKPLFPVGISFYIFQSISYILDVYKKNAPAEKNFFIYVLYVTFFPQLVIGPIEKGRHLIPQFKNLKFIGLQNCEEALHLILYGLFKKVYIGNNLGLLIDNSLNRQLDLLNLVFISILTTFKIYADFSGYSDVARGIGKLFNIELTINFLPFFNSKNPSQFWSTWHLSLTSWVKEYLFGSLIGKNPTPLRFYISLFLSFIIIGIWHGPTANWFVFGLFHGTVVIAYRLIKRNSLFVRIPDFFGYLFMLFFYAVCGILHNNTDLQKINFSAIFQKSLDTDYFLRNFILSILFLGPLVFFDKLQMKYKKEFFLYDQQLFIRYGVYLFWFFSILLFNHSNQGFVYYQF